MRWFVETMQPNFQLVGRHGMHRYNNQDHSMLTAICAARNILGTRINLRDPSADTDLEESMPFKPLEIAARDATQPPVPAQVRAAGSAM